jgi:L-histidine N-alpha-methyltransferase
VIRQGALRYAPNDISRSVLVQSAHGLLSEYPRLSIAAQAAEYDEGLSRLTAKDPCQKLTVFMGSNLSNFDPARALKFLVGIRNVMAEDQHPMIANDLAKDESVLIPEYNDAQGITAAFNLNILHRINRELGGSFDASHLSREFDYLARNRFSCNRQDSERNRKSKAPRARAARIEIQHAVPQFLARLMRVSGNDG